MGRGGIQAPPCKVQPSAQEIRTHSPLWSAKPVGQESTIHWLVCVEQPEGQVVLLPQLSVMTPVAGLQEREVGGQEFCEPLSIAGQAAVRAPPPEETPPQVIETEPFWPEEPA